MLNVKKHLLLIIKEVVRSKVIRRVVKLRRFVKPLVLVEYVLLYVDGVRQ